MPSKSEKPVPRFKCVACQGTGKNSKGNECYPCGGTGLQRKESSK